jgi:hypothetical protein
MRLLDSTYIFLAPHSLEVPTRSRRTCLLRLFVHIDIDDHLKGLMPPKIQR